MVERVVSVIQSHHSAGLTSSDSLGMCPTLRNAVPLWLPDANLKRRRSGYSLLVLLSQCKPPLMSQARSVG